MYLISKSSEHETAIASSDATRPARAGLRLVTARTEPTGLFVAVEMAVLVLVTALAMVSIIVSGAEDESAQRVGQAATRIEHHGAGERAGDRRVPPYRPAVRASEADIAIR